MLGGQSSYYALDFVNRLNPYSAGNRLNYTVLRGPTDRRLVKLKQDGYGNSFLAAEFAPKLVSLRNCL